MEKVYFILNSYMGMYITQSVFHSAVAAVLADCSIVAWNVTAPARRQAMRIGVILIPIVAFPFYQLLDPERGGIHFRLDALLDSSGWLLMMIWGRVPVMVFFIGILALAALIFLLQEFLPIVLHTVKSVGKGQVEGASEYDEGNGELAEKYDDAVFGALGAIPGEKPEVMVIDDEDLVVFSSTGRVPVVYVSTGLIDMLEPGQLRGAIAHEIAHIRRTRKPVLTFLFVFRVFMFFNPVALFEFRRAVQDEEEICDDEAVRATGDPAALSEALSHFLEGTHTEEPEAAPDIRGHIENYSQDMLIRKRIARLNSAVGGDVDRSGRLSVPVFVLCTAVVNYFIV